MKIKINGGEFKKTIGAALKSTATSNINANDIINITTADNKLVILSGASDFILKQKLKNVIIEEEGSINVSAAIINAIVRTTTNEEVSLITDDTSLKIKQGKNSSKIALAKENNISDILKTDILYSLEVEPKKLKKLIESTSYAVAQDESRPVLLGQYIELEKNKISITALDGFRLISNSVAIENQTEDKILIHSNNLKNISSLIDDKTEKVIINKLNNKIMAKVQNPNCTAIAASAIFTEEFIAYKQIVGDLSEYPIKMTVDRSQLLDTVERISVVSSFVKKGLHILMKINKDIVNIDSNNEVASMKGELNIISNSDEEFKIAFNPKYIIDALKNIKEKEIEIFFKDSVSPAIILNTDAEDINVQALVLPVRILS